MIFSCTVYIHCIHLTVLESHKYDLFFQEQQFNIIVRGHYALLPYKSLYFNSVIILVATKQLQQQALFLKFC